MFTRKEIIQKLIREEHEDREDKIVNLHKIEKDVEKYSREIKREEDKYLKLIGKIECYFSS